MRVFLENWQQLAEKREHQQEGEEKQAKEGKKGKKKAPKVSAEDMEFDQIQT